MDFAGYLRALRNGWWLILLLAVVGGGFATLYNRQATREYQSSVTFYISATPTGTSTNTLQANQLALDKVASYSELMGSELLANMVLERSGLTMTPAAVSNRVSVSSPLNTSLIDVKVVDSSPERSKVIADALAVEFGVLVDQVDNSGGAPGDARTAVVDVHVVTGPTLNPYPVSPRERLNLVIGVGGGLAIGVVLALLRVVLDTTVRDVESLRALTGMTVLGALTFDAAAKKSPVLVGDQTRSVRAESYRQLRTSLQFMSVENPVQVLVVTSAVSGEGKSTTASNLAIVYAESGRRVLLIEADMRRGRLDDYLGVEGTVGLSDVLIGDVKLDDVLQEWGSDGLMVLAGGTTPPNPSELLGSHRMTDLLAELRERFDTIIVDCPPLLPVTDAAVASTWADGTIVAVRHGRTSASRIKQAVGVLDAVDARVLGLVLSMHQAGFAKSRGYGSYDAYDRTSLDRRWWQFRAKKPAVPAVTGKRRQPDGKRRPIPSASRLSTIMSSTDDGDLDPSPDRRG